MKRLGSTLLILALLFAFAVPGRGFAQESVKVLADQAYQHYVAKEYQKAIELLQRARAIRPAPTIDLIEGRSYVGLGRYLEARERFRAASSWKKGASDPPAFASAIENAQRELVEVEGKIAKLTVEITPPAPAAKVVVDGVEREAPGQAIELDPGKHRVEIRGADAGDPQDVVLAEGARHTIQAIIRSREPVPTAPQQTEPERDYLPAAITFGVAGAVLTLGAVTGGLAVDRKAALDDVCSSKRCPEDAEGIHADAVAFAWTSTVALIVGGAGAVVGTVLVIVPPSKPAAPAPAQVGIGAGSVWLSGVW